jgi:predicted enzyme related to lactoylglutathione lyase
MQTTLVYAIKFVDDMDRGVAFYRDTLGLTLKFATPFWSEFGTGAVTLALHPSSERNPAGGVQLGFSTPGLGGVFEGREAAGLRFSAPPTDQHGSLISRILDSEGAEISLSDAKP